MNVTFQMLSFVASILIVLALVPALWVSGRIILRNRITADRSTRLFLWLALGGLFLIPLADLIRYLSDFILLVIPSDQNMGEVQLFLGMIPGSFYFSIIITIGVITYSSGIYYARKIIDERGLPVIEDLALSSLEKNFVALGLAGLFSEMVRSIILNFASIYIPGSSSQFSGGLIGSLAGLIGALMILGLVIHVMDRKLRSR